MAEARTLDRVKAEHLSDEVRAQLGLRADEEVRLTVEPVGQSQRNWLLERFSIAFTVAQAGSLRGFRAQIANLRYTDVKTALEVYGSWQGPETAEELIELINSRNAD